MDRIGRWLSAAGRRAGQVVLIALALYVVWWLFQRLTILAVTLAIALMVAALLHPVARWSEDRGLPRSVAVATALLGGLAVIAGIGWFVGIRIGQEVPQLTQQLEDVRASLRDIAQTSPIAVDPATIDQSLAQVGTWLQEHAGMLARRAFGLVGALGAGATALVIAFFVLRDTEQLGGWLQHRLVDPDQREQTAAAAARAGDAMQGYARAVVVIGGLDATLIGIALLLLGVPLAIPLAVLTFFGGFFPVVGATLAGFLAALVALASGGVTQALVVTAVVIAIQQLDGNVLQPVIMGEAVNLHPLVVVVALTAGGLLAGIVGAFLAVPTTAVLVAAVEGYREASPAEPAQRGRDADREAVPA